MPATVIDRLRSLRVSDAMTARVVPLHSAQSLHEAGRTFAEHGVSAAPVVDEAGRCVGIFSLADLLKAREAPDRLSFPPEAKASDFMTAKVLSTTPEASLLSAAALMDERHVHRLPVLDQEGRLAGVLSTMDIVASLLHAVDEHDIALLEEARREHRQ